VAALSTWSQDDPRWGDVAAGAIVDVWVMELLARHRRVLLVLVLVSFPLIFLAYETLEVPGLGIAQLYNVPVILVALACGPVYGGAAGLGAASLFATGAVLNGQLSHDVVFGSVSLRLVDYVGTGVLIGWLAQRDRLLVQRLRRLAERDFLTELPNARAFDHALDREISCGEPFVVLLADMDQLKQLNDREGHLAGDQALRRLASSLVTSMPAGSTAARLGGDEFAVLVPGPGATAELARRIESALDRESLHASIGWAECPRDGSDSLSLIRSADQRLYDRKRTRSRQGTLSLVADLP
jgi:diguanylate cyclase (GGDEF)-like protein